MKNKQISVQRCGIKILQIAVFVFAFYLMQTTANAQVALGKQNRISSVFSGKCILASKVVNGEQIIQMNCDKDFEPFVFQFAGGENFQIKANTTDAKGFEMCLDVKGGGTGNGTPVILWQCNNGKNQLWTAKPLGEGYQIKSIQSGKCLDVRGPLTTDGTPIQIWECGTATGKQMLYKITDMDIINDGSSSSPESNSGGTGGTGLTPSLVIDAADKTSNLIDQFTGENAFDGGNAAFFAFAGKLGKALKIFGAAAGLFDFILDIAKQDTPTIEEVTLQKVDKVIKQLDGLEAKQKQEFDGLKIFLKEQQAYDRLFKSDNVIDSQYSLWRVNEINLKKESDTEQPEYKSANDFINEASAIGNLCSGESGGKPIYEAVAEANKGKVTALPKLHVMISGKLSKAQTLGTFQRYRASYLTNLKSMTKKPNIVSNGVENQIAEIEKFEKAAGSNIAFEKLRTQHMESAKKQFANEIIPHWSKCEKALNAGIETVFAGVNIKQGVKEVVEKEFVNVKKGGNTYFDPKILPLLLTDSGTNIYSKGRGFGLQQRIDGSFDPSLAGGRFAAAIGKRLETLFPGYGFVVIAYSKYDGMPTIRSNVSNRCSGAKPIKWGYNEAGSQSLVKSNNQPLFWHDITVDGPLRMCSDKEDEYSFNLIVSGFRRETLAGDVKGWLDIQREAVTRPQTIFYNSVANARRDSEEYGKTIIAAATTNGKPNLVSVFAALPAFANGRRTDPVYYLYPSKFPDLVSYPSEVGNMFYVVSPNPF